MVGALSGCSGGSPAGGAGGGSGGGASGSLTYAPCADGTRAGHFDLELIEGVANAGPQSRFNGHVLSAADPRDNRVDAVPKAGGCRLLDAPMLTCSPACAASQICAGQNSCVSEPTLVDVGTVSLTGLSQPVMAPVNAGMRYYADVSSLAFPPFATGATVTLAATGGTTAAFSLSGRGVDPLQVASSSFAIARGTPLTVTWTAPAATGSTRMFVEMDIARHGSGTAQIQCEAPDNGSLTIPAPLIGALLDRGTAGFPIITLSRQTIDSKTVGSGCVEFVVASIAERALMIPGVQSCNPDDMPTGCPAGQICRPLDSPGGLTCGAP